jgi:betaine lipid synthase
VIQIEHLTCDRYNIEAMAAFLPVDKFFKHVYLVDLSPSLCAVARERFERLGWKNVTVLCQDARSFQLPEKDFDPRNANATSDGVDLITMSYSLSMIPGEYLGSIQDY